MISSGLEGLISYGANQASDSSISGVKFMMTEV